MNLDEKQKDLFKAIEAGTAETVAFHESMGMSHAMAKLTERIETTTMMLVPAMTSTGMIAGEVKNLYIGKNKDSQFVEDQLVNAFQCISQLGSVLNIPLSRIAEKAFHMDEEATADGSSE